MRVVLGVMLVIAFAIVQVLATVFAAVLVAAFTPDLTAGTAIDSLAEAGATTRSAVILLIGEVLLLATVGGAALRVLGAERCGLTRTGTRRGLLASLPIPLVQIGIGGAGLIAMHDPLIDPSLTTTRTIVLLVFVCVIGFTEELMYRGVLMSVLGLRTHPAFAIGWSAVLFGRSTSRAPTSRTPSP